MLIAASKLSNSIFTCLTTPHIDVTKRGKLSRKKVSPTLTTVSFFMPMEAAEHVFRCCTGTSFEELLPPGVTVVLQVRHLGGIPPPPPQR